MNYMNIFLVIHYFKKFKFKKKKQTLFLVHSSSNNLAAADCVPAV